MHSDGGGMHVSMTLSALDGQARQMTAQIDGVA